jgi:hypothetical protein
MSNFKIPAYRRQANAKNVAQGFRPDGVQKNNSKP